MPSREKQPNTRTQVLFASLVGTTVEFFDFYIYATAAVIIFPKLFFPSTDTTYDARLASHFRHRFYRAAHRSHALRALWRQGRPQDNTGLRYAKTVSLHPVADLSNSTIRGQRQRRFDSKIPYCSTGAHDYYAELFEAIYPAEAGRRRTYLDSKTFRSSSKRPIATSLLVPSRRRIWNNSQLTA